MQLSNLLCVLYMTHQAARRLSEIVDWGVRGKPPSDISEGVERKFSEPRAASPSSS
jgi:hypothetical protein